MPFMRWFTQSNLEWNWVDGGMKRLPDSPGSMHDALVSLLRLKRCEWWYGPSGLTIQDALTSRGCVYIYRNLPPCGQFQQLPVARLTNCDISHANCWTALHSVMHHRDGRISDSWPDPSCFPTVGPRTRPGWTQ
jgi:hypothetical protein